MPALFAARAAQRIDYHALAKASGVGANTLDRWHRGVAPRLDNLLCVLAVLGLEIALVQARQERRP